MPAEGGALRELFARFGFDFNTSDLDKGNQMVTTGIGKLQEFGAALGAIAGVRALLTFANEFEEAAGRIEDASRALDVSTTQLQELRFAASQAGVSAEQSDAAMGRFQQSVAQAAAGGGRAAEVFRRLGVNVRGTDGEVGNLSELMSGVAAGLGQVQDPAARAALATQLFGRAGRQLATVLHDGEGGLDALRGELAELGGGLFPEAIEAAGAYGDATDRLRVAQDSLRSVLAVGLFPALTWLVSRGTQVVAWLSRLSRETHVVQVGLAALGAVAAAAGIKTLITWLPVIAPFLAWAAVLATLVLLVDDLITMFEGGDSAVGRFLDRLGGVGTQQRVVREGKLAWEGLQRAIHVAGEALSGWYATLRRWDVRFTGWLDGLADSFRTKLAPVWQWLDRTFGATWDPIERKVREFFTWVEGKLQAAARAVGIETATPGAPGGRNPAGDTRGFFTRHQTLGLLNDLYNPVAIARNLSGMLGGGTATVPAPAGARTTTVTDNRRTVVQVNGAGNPDAVARQVVARLREQDQARRDADHPTEDR